MSWTIHLVGIKKKIALAPLDPLLIARRMDELMNQRDISGKVFAQRHACCEANHNVASHSWMKLDNARGESARVEWKDQEKARSDVL